MATNQLLKSARLGLGFSQERFAKRLGVSTRTYQRWENGQMTNPRPEQAAALQRETGLPLASLGFTVPGTDVPRDPPLVPHQAPPAPHASMAVTPNSGAMSGVWLSRYKYPSSGRGTIEIGLHHVVLLHQGDRLQGRSLADSSDSQLTLDLSVRGTVLTGTWHEQTHPDGYYRGAVYHGALQLLLAPTGLDMSGQWVGFGKSWDVNTGPWQMRLIDRDTSHATLTRYNHTPTSTELAGAPNLMSLRRHRDHAEDQEH